MHFYRTYTPKTITSFTCTQISNTCPFKKIIGRNRRRKTLKRPTFSRMKKITFSPRKLWFMHARDKSRCKATRASKFKHRMDPMETSEGAQEESRSDVYQVYVDVPFSSPRPFCRRGQSFFFFFPPRATVIDALRPAALVYETEMRYAWRVSEGSLYCPPRNRTLASFVAVLCFCRAPSLRHA